MSTSTSPFSSIPVESHVVGNDLAFAIRDKAPASPGHSLIIPRREIVTWFEATDAEWRAARELLGVLKADLDDRLSPTGYNVGLNAGRSAGQTVFHAHIHVIPRFDGDVPDPAGGVRHAVVGRGVPEAEG